MWERADGIKTGCRPARARLDARGLAGARLGATPRVAAAPRGPAEVPRGAGVELLRGPRAARR